MDITKLSIQRPVVIIVFYILITLLGVYAYSNLNYELVPRFTPEVITVATVYPGAGPESVEDNISKPIEDALSSIEKALSLAPREAYFLNNRGFIYFNMKNFEKAEADINESIGLDPYNAWAYRNKGILLLDRKDFTNAERLLKQSVDMDPFVDKIYFYLGLAYLNNGNKTASCEAFARSQQLGDGMVTKELMKGCR